MILIHTTLGTNNRSNRHTAYSDMMTGNDSSTQCFSCVSYSWICAAIILFFSLLPLADCLIRVTKHRRLYCSKFISGKIFDSCPRSVLFRFTRRRLLSQRQICTHIHVCKESDMFCFISWRKWKPLVGSCNCHYVLCILLQNFQSWDVKAMQEKMPGMLLSGTEASRAHRWPSELSLTVAVDGRPPVRAACPADGSRQVDEVLHTKGPFPSWSLTITGRQDKAISLHYRDSVFSHIGPLCRVLLGI